jgi:hypothetical protein
LTKLNEVAPPDGYAVPAARLSGLTPRALILNSTFASIPSRVIEVVARFVMTMNTAPGCEVVSVTTAKTLVQTVFVFKSIEVALRKLGS